jgi:hypothetical protein
MEDKSAHRKIIRAIHENCIKGDPFAIWEIRDLSGVSTSSVRRTMESLVNYNFIIHLKKGFRGRKYRVNFRWPKDVATAIKDYEFGKILEID